MECWYYNIFTVIIISSKWKFVGNTFANRDGDNDISVVSIMASDIVVDSESEGRSIRVTHRSFTGNRDIRSRNFS